MADRKSQTRTLDDTRAYIKETRARVKRVRGLPDDVRQTLKRGLNELRQSLEDGDSDEIGRRRETMDTLIDQHVKPHEKSAWREYAESIGIAILLALVLRGFVVEAFKIPTGSMIPTLLVGDHLFVNKFIYGIRVPFTKTYVVRFSKPKRGDVVVFSFPREEARAYLSMQPPLKRACIDKSSLNEEKDMIKRIVGVAGDTIEVRENQLIINNEPIKRTYLRKETTGNYLYPFEIHEREELGDVQYTVQYMGIGQDFGQIKVAPEHVFVMGDNRDNSSDGRCWGQVPIDNIKGRAMVIWWSVGPNRIRWERFADLIR